MSKFDEAIESYKKDLAELNVAVDEELLVKIAKGLGPSIYLKDASMVSATDKSELDRVKENFLIKKLGMSDEAEMDKAISQAVEQYNKAMKKRAVLYYLLTTNLKKKDLIK